MAALHSPYLWTIVLLAIWAGADSQETTCAEGGGTCVPEDDNSCAHEANYPGCDEDEICCTSASAVFVKRDADPCDDDPDGGKCKKRYAGIFETECHPDRIHIPSADEPPCKCCGCKIKNMCKRNGGHCITTRDLCDGDTYHDFCHGKKCTCCIPDAPLPTTTTEVAEDPSCECGYIEYFGCYITKGAGPGTKCQCLFDGFAWCNGNATYCDVTETCLGRHDYCDCWQGQGDYGDCGGYPYNCTNIGFDD